MQCDTVSVVKFAIFLLYIKLINIKASWLRNTAVKCFLKTCELQTETQNSLSLFHRAFFNSIMDKTPTHALFTQHYISLAC